MFINLYFNYAIIINTLPTINIFFEFLSHSAYLTVYCCLQMNFIFHIVINIINNHKPFSIYANLSAFQLSCLPFVYNLLQNTCVHYFNPTHLYYNMIYKYFMTCTF